MKRGGKSREKNSKTDKWKNINESIRKKYMTGELRIQYSPEIKIYKSTQTYGK